MEHLFNTFLHSLAWHSGATLAHYIGLPCAAVFIIYGFYKFFIKKDRKIRSLFGK